MLRRTQFAKGTAHMATGGALVRSTVREEATANFELEPMGGTAILRAALALTAVGA